MTRFAIDAITIHSTSMSAVTLRGVGSASHRLNRETSGPNSGNTYDEARFILSLDDEFAFGQVIALKSLLDVVSPLIGKCIADDETHPGLRLYGQSLSRCGTKGRGGSGTHAQVTAKLAHLLISEISGSKNQIASATLRGVNMLKSGETTPTATVYNANLPASPVVSEAFAIGPVEIAEIVIPPDSIMGVTVETGINVQVVRDLDGYVVDLLILKTQPRLRVQVEDSSQLDAAKIAYGGVAALHADTFVSFVALDPDTGITKALDGTHHIKVTGNGRAYIEDHLNGGGPAVAGSSIVVECVETSGGVAPLVVTTGVALA